MAGLDARMPAPTPAPALLLQERDDFKLPLTTVFTPPTSCLAAPFTLFDYTSAVGAVSSAWRDRNETSSDCYPSSFSSLEGYWGFYSPGVCPVGYNIAQTRVNTDPVTPTETVTQAWCCPAGMTFSGSALYQLCSSYVSSTSVALSGSSTLSGAIVTDIFTVTNVPSFIALQWPLSVEWRDKDLSLFTPASAPVLTTTSASTSSETPISTTASSTPTHAASGGGLSPAAEIAIGAGVGGGVCLLIVLGLIIFCCRRRRRKNKTSSPPSEAAAATSTGTPSYHALSGHTSWQLPVQSPLGDEKIRWPLSMDANAPRHEMLGDTPQAAELEARRTSRRIPTPSAELE